MSKFVLLVNLILLGMTTAFKFGARRTLPGKLFVATEARPELQTNNKFDYTVVPPFSLQDIKQAIPKHLFVKDTARSFSYLFRDVVIVAALAAGVLKFGNPITWPLYWLAQGTMFWALFVVGHDCGHGSFSDSNKVNNLVGLLTHSSILVPFAGWQISHRTHHQNHGNVDTDESWYPLSKTQYDNAEFAAKLGRYNPLVMMIAYPVYLWARTPPKTGSHFDPNCDLFKPSERNHVLTSTAAYFAMLGVLGAIGSKIGWGMLGALYGVPYLIGVAWLSVVTYLHHTDVEVPWYRNEEWNYMRGGLSTRDRDYGIFNEIHHNIGTHVVHHLFPQIPHYNIVEATEYIKPVLGKYFVEPEKSSILPFHLIKQWWTAVQGCKFVDDEGNILSYKSETNPGYNFSV